jgi:hypothetical protein
MILVSFWGLGKRRSRSTTSTNHFLLKVRGTFGI